MSSAHINGSSASRASVSRREVWCWIAATIALGYATSFITVASREALMGRLGSINAIVCVAWFVVFRRIWASRSPTIADRWDWLAAVVIAAAVVSTLPVASTIGTGLLTTLAGLALIARRRSGHDMAMAGAVLLAISTNILWGPGLLRAFLDVILQADAWIVGTLLARLRPDVVWLGVTFRAADGHGVALIGACSSFNNISMAMLACIAAIGLQRSHFVGRDGAVIAIAVLVMLAINVARLCLLMTGRADFAFWHDGQGAEWVALATTISALMIGLAGAGWSGRPR
jgi:hypothetical protein